MREFRLYQAFARWFRSVGTSEPESELALAEPECESAPVLEQAAVPGAEPELEQQWMRRTSERETAASVEVEQETPQASAVVPARTAEPEAAPTAAPAPQAAAFSWQAYMATPQWRHAPTCGTRWVAMTSPGSRGCLPSSTTRHTGLDRETTTTMARRLNTRPRRLPLWQPLRETWTLALAFSGCRQRRSGSG
eukprot:SAG11_NODE_7550_length_1130_cov_0.605238_1_plen_193_part_00